MRRVALSFQFIFLCWLIVQHPCAGITLYSPLMHSKAGPGKKIGIIGLGGAGDMGVKIAHALGSEVSVLSHSQEDGMKMGADKFYATSDHEADARRSLTGFVIGGIRELLNFWRHRSHPDSERLTSA